MKMLLFLLVTGSGLADTSFDVVHKKRLWFDQEGTVRIDASGISFQPAGKDEKTRSWGYEDIQFLDRMSPTEFRLLTYEDLARTGATTLSSAPVSFRMSSSPRSRREWESP